MIKKLIQKELLHTAKFAPLKDQDKQSIVIHVMFALLNSIIIVHGLVNV